MASSSEGSRIHQQKEQPMPTLQRKEADSRYIKQLEEQNRLLQESLTRSLYQGYFQNPTQPQHQQQGPWFPQNILPRYPVQQPPFPAFSPNITLPPSYPPPSQVQDQARHQPGPYQFESPIPPPPPPFPDSIKGENGVKTPVEPATAFDTFNRDGHIHSGEGSDNEHEAPNKDPRSQTGSTNAPNNTEQTTSREDGHNGGHDRSDQVKAADKLSSSQDQPGVGEGQDMDTNNKENSMTTGVHRYVRTVVKRWNEKRETWEEVEEDFEKSKDTPDQSVTFRREMDVDNPKKIYSEDVEIHSSDLKSLIAEADEWWRDAVTESTQSITIEEPFESFVWNWDRYVKTCEDKDDDQPPVRNARLALKETLQILKNTTALEPYFRSREQIMSSKKIRFDYLWTLFGHGSKVYARSYMKQLQMFEVKSCSMPPYKGKRFRLSCSAFDWDGSKFSTYTYDFYIKEFSGEMPVNSLEVFPTEFYHNEQDIHDDTDLREQLLKRGRKYCELCTTEPTKNQCEYQGTAIAAPSGLHRLAAKGRAEDPALPYSDPRWAYYDGLDLNVTSIDVKGKESRVIIDSYAFMKSERNTMKRGEMPPLGNRVPYTDAQCVCGVCKTSPLQQWRSESSPDRSLPGLRKAFSADLNRLLFLPPRLLGFAFKEKLWGQFLVESLESASISGNKESMDPFWEELQLDRDSKELLIAYVKHHKAPSSRIVGQDPSSIDARAFDIIEGKGQGLVILLHGPPGVGKTLTAETVALATNKPLLTVSVAEMGVEAQEAERKLTDVFSDTARWGAVLLMDEADVFVEERIKGELDRNALVSVLLRCLEYYDGIIILTTNRVRSIDSAVQSRVHLAIQYHDLNPSQRVAIFKNRLRWIPDEEVQDRKGLERGLEVSALGKKSNKANGRQVRNIVIGARALAKRKNEKLTLDHLMTVYETTVAFIDGMADLVNKQRALNEAP